MEKLSLTILEAQKTSGLSKKQIMKYVRRGDLPYLNVGDGDKVPRYRIRSIELEKLLQRLEKLINQGVENHELLTINQEALFILLSGPTK